MDTRMLFRLLGILVTLCLLSGACVSATPTPKPTSTAPTITVSRPTQPIVDGQPFSPATDRTVPGGTYTVPSVNIPKNVAVAVTGDLFLNVTGKTNIAGALKGGCVKIALQGQEVSVTGTIDNQCAEDNRETKDLTISTNGGILAIGTADSPATIRTSGNLDITNDPALTEARFDMLPYQRSSVSVAPVCSARADRVVDTAASDLPAQIGFYGRGIDPDGGVVTFKWEFGDGTSATQKEIAHSYGAWGKYDVRLTVSDDEGKTCQATLRVAIDDGDTNIPNAPGVWVEPFALAVEAGQEVLFASDAQGPQGRALTFAWDFGDSTKSTDAEPSHIYAKPGRYALTLTAFDDLWRQSTATASIYVYNPPTASLSHLPGLARPEFEPVRQQVVNVTMIGFLEGWNITGRLNGNVILIGGRNVHLASDGRKGGAFGRGRDGGAGGNYKLYVTGDLTIGNGLTIIAGNGGQGVTPIGFGNSLGGQGGKGGDVDIRAEGNIVIQQDVSIAAGKGGNGSSVKTDDTARGGNGGQGGSVTIEAGKTETIAGSVSIGDGDGGDGGNAEATGRVPRAFGGKGGRSSSYLGFGGKQVQFTAPPAKDVNFKLGNGGKGGNATATGNPGACGKPDGANAFARAGDGGEATRAAHGWNRVQFGVAITVVGAEGGPGGTGNAIGGDGMNAACGQVNGGKGGSAEAFGGKGGDGILKSVVPQVINIAGAFKGGKGGDASAIGGKGGDAACGGNGGDGSAARAEGYDGSFIIVVGGNGGKGGNCAKGGNGGNGGNASAAKGPGANDVKVNPRSKGGDGGNGGSGNPPGKGGKRGEGFGVSSGTAGIDGNTTAKTPAIVSTATPVKTVLATRSLSTRPEVVAINFPSSIPADGTRVRGTVQFRDAEGDVNLVRFDIGRAAGFEPFQFNPLDFLIEGNAQAGVFRFETGCNKKQEVTLGIRLYDKAGNVSEIRWLTFDCK